MIFFFRNALSWPNHPKNPNVTSSLYLDISDVAYMWFPGQWIRSKQCDHVVDDHAQQKWSITESQPYPFKHHGQLLFCTPKVVTAQLLVPRPEQCKRGLWPGHQQDLSKWSQNICAGQKRDRPGVDTCDLMTDMKHPIWQLMHPDALLHLVELQSSGKHTMPNSQTSPKTKGDQSFVFHSSISRPFFQLHLPTRLYYSHYRWSRLSTVWWRLRF